MNKLRTQPSGETASGRSWNPYSNPRAVSSSRTLTLHLCSVCIVITRGKKKNLKEQSQSHFFDCQNECKELTLHLEKQTNVKWRADLPASEPFLHAADPPQTCGGLCVSCLPAIMSRAHFIPYLPKTETQTHLPTHQPTNQKKERGTCKASEEQK